jgi:DNA primase
MLKNYKKGKGTTICPFHKEETPSCFLDMARREFHCLSCGTKGTFKIEFIKEEKD